jgi:hypothetical protein
MSRVPLATIVGLVGFAAYVVGVVTLADQIRPMNWLVQALYFLVAGIAWVIPARWLMLWAARK